MNVDAAAGGRTLEGYSGDACSPATEYARRGATLVSGRRVDCPLNWLCADDRPLLMRRRTRYSLIGRATLGVKATHQKLRLGAEPRGAPQSLTAGRQCSLNRLLLRALLSVTHTDTPRVLLSPEMLRGGMSQRSAECPCSTAS